MANCEIAATRALLSNPGLGKQEWCRREERRRQATALKEGRGKPAATEEGHDISCPYRPLREPRGRPRWGSGFKEEWRVTRGRGGFAGACGTVLLLGAPSGVSGRWTGGGSLPAARASRARRPACSA